MPLDRGSESSAACTGTRCVPQEHAQHFGDVAGRDSRPAVRAKDKVRVDVLGLEGCEVTTGGTAPLQKLCRTVPPLVNRTLRQAALVAHPRNESIERRCERDRHIWLVPLTCSEVFVPADI